MLLKVRLRITVKHKWQGCLSPSHLPLFHPCYHFVKDYYYDLFLILIVTWNLTYWGPKTQKISQNAECEVFLMGQVEQVGVVKWETPSLKIGQRVMGDAVAW